MRAGNNPLSQVLQVVAKITKVKRENTRPQRSHHKGQVLLAIHRGWDKVCVHMV